MITSASMNAKTKAQGGLGFCDPALLGDYYAEWADDFPEDAAHADAVMAGLEVAIEDLHRMRNTPGHWRNKRAGAVIEMASEMVGACMEKVYRCNEPVEPDYTALWAKVYEVGASNRPGPKKLLASATQVYLLTYDQVGYLGRNELEKLLERAWVILAHGSVHNESCSRTHGKHIPKRPDRLGTVEPLC